MVQSGELEELANEEWEELEGAELEDDLEADDLTAKRLN